MNRELKFFKCFFFLFSACYDSPVLHEFLEFLQVVARISMDDGKLDAWEIKNGIKQISECWRLIYVRSLLTFALKKRKRRSGS